MLQIHLLGPFTINLDGQSLTNHDWHTQQTQTIGKILLIHRGEVVTSDQLIDILWPDETVESARKRLHVRISQLRKGLKDQSALVRTVHGGYIFETDPSCWVDVDAFQSLITQGTQYLDAGQQREAVSTLEQARSLYRGDYLAEDIYESWTFTQREYYREQYLNLLLQLSECYAQQGRYRLAISNAQNALNHDPLRETIYVRLMLYHYYAGDRTQALSVFDHYQNIVGKELGIPPLESTCQLAEQIRSGTLWKNDQSPRYPPPIYEGRLFEVPYALDEIPFVSRDREYAWLVSQWENPHTQVLSIEGEAGIGKSRLIESFAGYITSQGVQVLNVRLAPGEQTPTAAVSNSLRTMLTANTLMQLSPAILAALAQRFPELHQQVPHLPQLSALPLQAESQRLDHAISALLTLHASQPIILIIDDAHRLNATAVNLVEKLSQNIKILLSYRGEETPADHPIRTTFGSAGLTLKPLHENAVQTIIRLLSGDDHPHISQHISTFSQGNPLFVVALLQHMFESGQLYVHTDGGWMMTEQDTSSMPATLQEAIKNRLDRLDRGVRRIIEYAAVMGGEFDFELMQAVSQQPDDILLTNLDQLMDSALLVEPHNHKWAEFRISHDRYTEVTYEYILPVRKKQMHLQVAQAIEAVSSGRLEQVYTVLADHYNRAEKSEPTIRYAKLAGEQAAARFTNQEALYFFKMALAHLSADEIPKRAQLLLAREQVFDLNGLRDSQNEDLKSLETLSPHLNMEQQAEIHLRRAGFAWIMGDNAEAEHAVTKAITKSQTCNARSVHARALFLAGKIASSSSQANPYFDQARKIAIESQQRALEAEIVRWMGNVNFWTNNYSQTQAYFEEALAIHREVGDFRGELSALNNLGHLFENFGQPEKAVELYAQAGAICQKIGDRLAEGVILTNLGGLKTQLGQFLPAQEDLEKALVIRKEIGNDEGVAVIHADLGDIYRQQGHFQKALDHYQTAIEINTIIGHDQQKGGALTGLSALYRELGAYQQAQDCLTEAIQHLPDADSPRFIHALAQLSLLNHLLGEHQEAFKLGEQARSKSGNLLPLQANALKNIGHALAGTQQRDDARQNYHQAIGLYRQLGQIHLAAEPLAGLAHCAQSNQDLQFALDTTQEILDCIDGQPLQGPDRVVWIYLTCYRVLDQIKDHRAVDVLQSVYTLIHQRAASLTEGASRSAYLEKVPENRQVAFLWGQLNSSH